MSYAKQLFITSILALPFNLNAFADTASCPDTDPTIGSSKSAFTQATIAIGSVPQFPDYKGAVVCSYLDNKTGNVYPYTSAPTPITPSNWVGPTKYMGLLLYACINSDAGACQYTH
jgi:hypothetical protein